METGPQGDDEAPSEAWAEISALWSGTAVGAWVVEAACAGMGEVFTTTYPPDAAEIAVMERVCRRCPVRRECGRYAEDAEDVRGYWAGIWRGRMRSRGGRRPIAA